MNYITWDVDRIIFQIYGPLAIRWYSLFFLIGFLIGFYAFTSMAKKEGKNPDSYTDSLLFYLIMGTLIGARIGHCLFYQPGYYLSHPLTILKIWEGGLASHGGYLGIIIAVALFVRKHKELTFFWVMDRVGILAVMTGGFIRLGNLFNSEIYGRVTDVPWAFIFTKVDSLPRHPTQIYESIGFFTGSFIVYLFYRYHNRKPLEGRILGLCMILGFFFRTIIETFKENQVRFEDHMILNMGQILSIPFVLCGFYLFLGFHKKYLTKKKNNLKSQTATS